MVLWSEDYLTAKLDQANSNSAKRTNSSDDNNNTTNSILDHLSAKPKNWLEDMSNDPDFLNPHQLEAVAQQLRIRQGLATAPDKTLQDWETVDRLQELDRQALMQQQQQ
jgi:hypothetical protein